MKAVPTSLDGPWYFRAASFVLYNLVAIPAVFLIGVLVYGLRIRGRHRLRGHRRGLVAANHCQFLEPGICGVTFWPRKILFSAEENNVTRRDVGWLTRLLRAVGIPDDNPMGIGSTVRKGLESGWFVQFYPEGRLSWRSQEPGPFLEGVFFFAFLNDVPVFPLTEVLLERPIRRLFPWWPPRTEFIIGEPVYPDSFRDQGLSRREMVHRMSEAVRQVIIDTIAERGGCTELPERRPPD